MKKLKWVTNFNPFLYDPAPGYVVGPPRPTHALSSDDIANCGYKGLYLEKIINKEITDLSS